MRRGLADILGVNRSAEGGLRMGDFLPEGRRRCRFVWAVRRGG